MSKALDSIRVAIRVRPLLKRESGSKPNWQVEENTIIQLNDGKRVSNAAFTFDRIFDKDMATVDLYMDFAKPIVLSVMEGINGTLFAYGQTASGKTYTMTGDENSPGIIPYALGEVFDYISDTVNREFLLRVSYMEIYNEVITDLLKPKHTNLKIHENAQKEVFVGDLTEEIVKSVEAIIDLMKIGERNRHFGCTNMNERSSRSHTIFRMVIESRETSRNSMGGGEVDGAVKVSHLNLVDLAGSERASATGAEGIRLREGGFINKSLFALGNVINKLSEDESAFVPFRDSKLTRILQTSLGGNAKTSIICAITPASMDETLSTLQFASRAKTIKNRPEVNEVCDETTLLKRYKRQINELKKQIEQFTNQEPMIELQTEKEKMEQLLHEQRELAAKQREKMLELANFFCTARPKETEKQTKRQKRRWTVCPMGALSKPPMHLDLPSSFGQGFMMPNKRLKATDDSTDSLRSGDFNQNNLNRFFAEIDEKEEEIDDGLPSEGIIPIVRSHGSLLSKVATNQEKRRSLAENGADERIAELELELKRLAGERDAIRDERDAIRNDLSENITSSCEIQEDLLKTKQTLKEKRQQNREMQDRINQLEALRGSSTDKQDDEKQILELTRSLSKERDMLAITEATFSDICLAKEEVDKELAKYKEDNQALVTDFKAAAVAKEEATTECHRLRELQKELEEKVELFDVIQGDLETVDALQEELCQEQEKNGALLEEVRKSKDDNQKLREELVIQVKLLAGSQPDCSFPDQETTLTKTNEMFEESVKKLQLLEEENIQLRQKVEEQQVTVIEGLKQRVQQLEVENTLALEFKTSVTESYEDTMKEQANEISELKQKVKQLTRKRRRAGINLLSLESNLEVDSLVSLVEELEKKVSLQEEYREFRDVVTQVKKHLTRVEGDGCEEEDKVSEDGGLLVVEKKRCDIEELQARNSQLVQELEDVKREQQQSRSVNECNGDDNDKLDTDKLETELREATARSVLLVEEHETTLAFRQKEFNMELEKRNLELIEKDKVVDTLIKELEETKLAKEASDSCNRSGGLTIGVEQKPECCVLETCKTIEEVREKLRQAPMTCDPAFSEEQEGNIVILLKKFSEELERKETELGERNVAICELKQKLEQATYESELKNSENGNWSVDFKKDLDNGLGGKDAESEEMSPEVLKLREELEQAVSARKALSKDNEERVDNLQKEFKAQLERKERELELLEQTNTDCDTNIDSKKQSEERDGISTGHLEVAELRMQLEQALAAKESFADEREKRIDDLRRKFQEDLKQKDIELQEWSSEIDYLKKRLEEQRMSVMGPLQENTVVETLEEELANKEIELEDKSSEIDRLKKQLEDRSLSIETPLQENTVVEEQLATKEIELREKCSEIEELKKQLEDLSMSIRVPLQENTVVEEQLATKEIELREKCSEIEELKKQLEDLSMSIRVPLRENTVVEDQLATKEIELREKCSEIEELKKQLEDLSMSIRVPLRENTVVEDQLATKEIELREKCSEIEELKKQLEDLSMSIRVPLRENTVVEDQLATKEIELREKCSEIEELKKQLEDLSMSIRVPLQENTVVEEQLATKEIELREKCSEIEELKKQLEDLSMSIRVPLRENTVVEEQLATKEIELREKCSEIEELKKQLEDLSMSIRVALRENAVVEALEKELGQLQEQLREGISSKELLQQEHESLIASLNTKFQEEVTKTNTELEKELDQLQEQLREAISSKELFQQEHESLIASLNTKFQEEVTKTNTELEKEMSVVGELQEQLQQEISEKEALSGDFKQDIARLQKTFDIELEEKNSEIEEKDILRKATDEQLHETIRSKEALVLEHDSFISRLKNEFAEELQVLRTAVEDKSNSVDQLQESLQDTSASRDSLKRNLDELASHKKELELELQRKSDAFEEKRALVVSLEEQINDFAMAKEELIREHEALVERLGKEIGEEKKRMDDLLEEKSSLCAKVEDERIRVVSENEVLVQDREEMVARLKKEYCEDVERLSSVIEEKSSRVRELEEDIADKEKKYEERILENEEFQRNTEALVLESKEITAALDQKRIRISQVESELAKELETREALTEERNSVLSKCQRLEEEISLVRLDLITKSDELVALERKASDTDTTMQALNQEDRDRQEDLRKNNEILREECGRLEAQVKELLEQNTADDDSKDELISELRKHVDHLTKESDSAAASTESGEDCRGSKEKRRKRESLLFKSMLEDIKEQCSADAGDTSQDKLIDELNYTLVATQEKLEQKEFMIDEKEIEIMERDELVADLEGKLHKADKLGASHEGMFATLQSDVEQKSRETEDLKIRFERAEGALEKAKKESEGIVSQLRNDKNELQSKLEEYESILSEEQLKELYHSMEEKDKTINDLEQELSDASKNERRVLELEMEMDVLLNEVSSWKNSSEEAQGSLKDLKEIIKEQENHIVELESLKERAKLKQDEERDCELRDLRRELEAARSRLESFAEEKNKLEQKLNDFSKKEQKILELEMELEVLQNEVSSWKYNSEEAQRYLRDSEEINRKQEGRILELESSKASVNENQETDSELQEVRVELETARSRLESFEKEKNRGLEILEEKNRLLGDYEDEIDALNEDLDKKGEELKEATERLENALQERKEMETRVGKAVEEVKVKKEGIKDKETQVNKAVEEINATKAELKEIQDAYRTVSSERERALKQLSDQDQSSVIEKLRKDLALAEGTYDEMMDERFRMEKIINEQEAESEEYKQKIEALEEAKKSRGNLRDGKLQAEAKAEREKEWKEKEQEMKKMKEDNEFMKEYVEQRDEDYARLNGFIQEMEDEIDEFKERVNTLESEKENLEKREADKENTSLQQQQRQQSKEASEFKSQIKSLETEVKRLRDLVRVDLEEELNKVKNELKTKNLDLYHVSYEKEKQLDSAKSQIRHLEKDCSSYARKNNDLKIEIRRLRNQDDDPTIEIVNRQQSSSRNGDNVGVVGSVALFTLDAKVAQLQEENGKSKHQIEKFQQQNEALNITNLDLKQRYREVFDKYNRLKEMFAKNTEAAKLRDNQSKTEPKTHPKLDEKSDSQIDPKVQPKVMEPKAKDQRPADPMQASKQQESRFTQSKVASALSKAGTEVETLRRKPTVLRQNKENVPREKPDACNTQ